MKSLFTRRLVLLLSVALLATAFLSVFSLSPALAEEDEEEELGMLSIPLPIDFSAGCLPVDSCYLDENTYADPTIRVEITEKDVISYSPTYGRSTSRNVTAWIAEVWIGHASQLRTAPSEAFDAKKNHDKSAEEIAESKNAVLAFDGDYITRMNDGYLLRQGTFYWDKLTGKIRDILLIDEAGDFHPYHIPKRDTLPQEIDGKKIINAFCFGPILVEDGDVCAKMPDFKYLYPKEHYGRIAICQLGPLHYKVIATTMIQNYSLGLPLKEFAQLCKDEGAITAYNLDGGYSTALLFNGRRLNVQKKVTFRKVADIVYFASSWSGVTK